MTDKIPYFEDPRSKPIEGVPTVDRDSINAVLFDPKTDKVLCLDWPKFDWHTFIIGGIDKGEDPVNCAEREVLEETGYKNVRLVAIMGKIRAGYYAAHKKENRVSTADCILFELIDDEQFPIKESETTNHFFKWIPKDDVAAFINLTSQSHLWKMALEKLG